MSDEGFMGFIVVGVIVLIVAAVMGFMLIGPTYNVWAQGKAGEAGLKRAESEKLILIETAKAELEAATFQKKILVEQAEAEAAAALIEVKTVEMLGEVYSNYPEYRNQRFIAGFEEAMRNGAIEKMFFVPTEANIPIIKTVE